MTLRGSKGCPARKVVVPVPRLSTFVLSHADDAGAADLAALVSVLIRVTHRRAAHVE
ncbi:hypothetical protein [Streptomyces sp. NPDC053755]|uniref:hypothetical protein n=1 Tax=Streptomyces sp. NPDC053755 TaxID=3155815 RepID=UPI00343FD1F1